MQVKAGPAAAAAAAAVTMAAAAASSAAAAVVVTMLVQQQTVWFIPKAFKLVTVKLLFHGIVPLVHPHLVYQ